MYPGATPKSPPAAVRAPSKETPDNASKALRLGLLSLLSGNGDPLGDRLSGVGARRNRGQGETRSRCKGGGSEAHFHGFPPGFNDREQLRNSNWIVHLKGRMVHVLWRVAINAPRPVRSMPETSPVPDPHQGAARPTWRSETTSGSWLCGILFPHDQSLPRTRS